MFLVPALTNFFKILIIKIIMRFISTFYNVHKALEESREKGKI